MHPIIARLISDSFYEGKVTNYELIDDLVGEPALYNDLKTQPITFFNVKGYEEFTNNSYINSVEAKFVVSLV